MSAQQRVAKMSRSGAGTAYGQVIEYIQGPPQSRLIALPILTAIQTGCTWPPSPTHPMPTRPSSTWSVPPSRRRSARPRRNRVPPLRPSTSTRLCTSPSTRACCTTLSTLTSGHCTLAICTALRCSYTKSWETRPTRIAPSSSGAAPIQGVRTLPCMVELQLTTNQVAQTPRVSWPATWSSSSHGHRIWLLRLLRRWILRACHFATQATARLTMY